MNAGETKDKSQYAPSYLGDFFLLQEAIGRNFDVESLSMFGDMLRFTYGSARRDLHEIRREFETLGYRPFFGGAGARRTCILIPLKSETLKSRRREIWIALLLFFVTLATTTLAGWYFSSEMVKAGLMESEWPGALGFSLSLLLILGSHEMAHKWASRRHGIDSSPPYFIPLPSVIPHVGLVSLGTMGALIRVRSPIPDKNAAVALGVSGPLAGFLVALPILTAGLLMSKIVPIPHLPEGEAQIYFGTSLLVTLLERALLNVPDGKALMLHPIGMAAWIGLFVTSLNLIPIGQLDGGHIAHAVLGEKRFRTLCWALIGLLVVMSAFWQGWVIWAIIGYILTRRGYPRSMDEETPLTPASRAFAAAGLIMLILCFMPVPMMIK